MRNFRKFLAFTLAVLMIASTVITVSASNNFVDVTATDDYAAEINHLADLGILDITSELDTFNSTSKVQRYRLAVWLAALESGIVDAETWEGETNTTSYTDLTKYQAAISYVVSMELLVGESTTEFQPNGYVTLAEICAAFAYLFDYEDEIAGIGANGWKWSAVRAARDNGLINLDTFLGKFDPNYQITRGDAAYLLMNALYFERNDGTTIANAVFGLSETNYPNAQTVQLIATSEYALWGTTAAEGYLKFAVLNEDGTYEAPIVVSVSDVNGIDVANANQYVSAFFKIIANDDATVVTACSLVSNVQVLTSGVAGVDGNIVINEHTYAPEDIIFETAGLSSVTVNGAKSTAKYVRSVRCTFDTNGDPIWYNADGSLARGIYYGTDTDGDGVAELVADYMGGVFYIGANNEIVMEIVPDVNGIGYYGVVMAGQWGKNQNGNNAIYRYANDADWANVAVSTTSTVETSNVAPVNYAEVIAMLSLKPNQVTYTIYSYDDNNDGIIDRLYLVDIATYEIGKINASDFNGKPYDKIENLDGSAVTALVGDDALACVNGTTLIIKELYPLTFGRYDETATSFNGFEYNKIEASAHTNPDLTNFDNGDYMTAIVIDGVLYVEATYDVQQSVITVVNGNNAFAGQVYENVSDVNGSIEKVAGLVENDIVYGTIINNRFTKGQDTLFVLNHYPLWTGIYNENSFAVLSQAATLETAAQYVSYEITKTELFLTVDEVNNGDIIQAYVIDGVLYVMANEEVKVGEITLDNTHILFAGEEFTNYVNLTTDNTDPVFANGVYVYGCVVENMRDGLGYHAGNTLMLLDTYTFVVDEVVINNGETYFGETKIAGLVEITTDVAKNLTSGDYALAFIDGEGKLWVKEVYDLVLGDITVNNGKVEFNGTAVEKIDYLAEITEVVENGDKALAVLENGNLHVKAIYKFTYADFTSTATEIKFGEVIVKNVTTEAGVATPVNGNYVYATVIDGTLIVRAVYEYVVAEYNVVNGAHQMLDTTNGKVIGTAETLINKTTNTLKANDYVLAVYVPALNTIIVKEVYPVQTGEILGFENIAEDTAKVVIKVDGGTELTLNWASNSKTTLLTNANTVALRTELATRYVTFIASTDGTIYSISERLSENANSDGLVGSVSVNGNTATIVLHQENGNYLSATISDVLRNIYRYPTNNVFNYQDSVVYASNLAYNKNNAIGTIGFASLKWAATSTVLTDSIYVRAIETPANITPYGNGYYTYSISGEGNVIISDLTVFELLTFVTDGKDGFVAKLGDAETITGLKADTKVYLYTPVENGANPYFSVSEYTVGEFVIDEAHDIAGSIKAATVFVYGDALIVIGEGAVKHDASTPIYRVAVIPGDTAWDLRYELKDGRIYAVYTTQTDIKENKTGANLGKVTQIYEVDTYGATPANLIWNGNHTLYNVTISSNEIVSQYNPSI